MLRKEKTRMNRDLEIITSRQNALLVEAHKLSDRKHRARTERFRFDGVKLAAEALSRDVPLYAVLLRASDARRVLERVFSMCGKEFSADTRVVSVADGVFDSLSEESAPEGVLCVGAWQKDIHRGWTEEIDARDRVLLLESVRDPSNLGAIIRTAAAFGVDRLILSADCADIYNAKTVRASMGTLFSQRIDRADDVCAVIASLRAQGRRTFGAALDDKAARLGELSLQRSDCAIIGNEGHGLSERVIAACDRTLYIPMTERAESLNAAVAAAVLMWELCRNG